jgi:hypothetical protein
MAPSAFKEVSEETRRQVAESNGSRLGQRDPSMHGDHHKCNKCDEFGKYIAKKTHWCGYHLDLEEYSYLAGMSREEYEAFRKASHERALSGPSKSSIVNAQNLSKIGFVNT